MKHLPSVILAALCVFLAGRASATTSGCVRGQMRFIQANQGYCPNTRSCAGVAYVQSQYKNASGSPLRKIKVELKSGVTVLGQAVTDDSGNFTMTWTSAANATSGHLRLLARMSDGGSDKFKVGQWNVSSDDTYVIQDTPIASFTNGTNCSNPQVLSTITIGTTTTPNDIANIYDSAERMWRYSASYTSVASELPVIDIEYPSDSTCGTGCQITGTKRIGIPNVNSDAFLGGARTAHEIGHLLVARVYPHAQNLKERPPGKFAVLARLSRAPERSVRRYVSTGAQ